MGCFVLARCLQLGQVLTKNDAKSQEYYIKVQTCPSELFHEACMVVQMQTMVLATPSLYYRQRSLIKTQWLNYTAS